MMKNNKTEQKKFVAYQNPFTWVEETFVTQVIGAVGGSRTPRGVAGGTTPSEVLRFA